jgi:short-subunit dehydrogenase
VGFSEALFEEVREQGLKVACILPGFVDTALLDAPEGARARMLRPDDVAEAVLFVLGSSPRSCPSEIVLRPQRSPFRAP